MADPVLVTLPDVLEHVASIRRAIGAFDDAAVLDDMASDYRMLGRPTRDAIKRLEDRGVGR
jgi:hypothetical protein